MCACAYQYACDIDQGSDVLAPFRLWLYCKHSYDLGSDQSSVSNAASIIKHGWMNEFFNFYLLEEDSTKAEASRVNNSRVLLHSVHAKQ
ncbi:hypothetical protein Hanom_Chr08g00714261 [Helianthus anomalus]